ncbi:hypothetical protein FSP39_001249 [Pinctada imbricata]|uniref:Uncharacterized protein n=1 Tax=Pinctada imbricata TaxID=66713 RepID=A0AA88XIX8_PINIB|nr:hypothetical protein FSP39_001249 [Pinctada imbricata]
MPSGLHGVSGERVFGAAGRPQNTAVLMDTIYKLKQDLQKSDEEKRALAEQLNCLVLLVKRSWSGDHNASLHLGNIVGVTPPDEYITMNLNNTPVPDEKTPAVCNWERLAIRLLDREYARVQEEIRHQQLVYIESRQQYMDELLVSHQKDMNKVPIKRQQKSLEEVDENFMRTFNRRANTSTGGRPTSGAKPRAKSAGVIRQRSNSHPNHHSNTNLTLNDILNPHQAHSNHVNPNTNTAFQGLYKLDAENEQDEQAYNRMAYDDPNRYKPPGKLFDFDAVLGTQEQTKKPRPISAFMPRERGKISRPQSAGVFLTQKNERPMKYETTRPVSAKTPGKQQNRRKKSANGNLRSMSESAIINQVPIAETVEHVPEEENVPEAEEEEMIRNDEQYSDEEVEQRAPIKINVGNYQKRPAHVDKFAEDLKRMEQMENEFKKNTLQLQKKLGIDEMGTIY